MNKFTSRKFLLAIIGMIMLLFVGRTLGVPDEYKGTYYMAFVILAGVGMGTTALEDGLHSLASRVDIDAVVDRLAQRSGNPLFIQISDNTDFNKLADDVLDAVGDDLDRFLGAVKAKQAERVDNPEFSPSALIRDNPPNGNS